VVVRRIAPLLLAALLLIDGCGDSGDSTQEEHLTVVVPSTTTTSEPPSGPLVRICDQSLSSELSPVVQPHGIRGVLRHRPIVSGAGQLSACDFGQVELSLDAARDAVQRYQNRIVETAQFSESEPDRVPRTVKGIGDPDLGAAGANWIPFLHQLLSARGKRVLIVTVNGGGLSHTERLEAAKAVSLAVWDRL
jgi:hypothetical protein